MLTELVAQQILQTVSLPAVHPVKQYNHVYQISYGQDVFFLKTYTKDWYGDNIAGTAYCVDHERTAWQNLAKAGLTVPVLILAEENMTNPLGRPFLLMKSLRGKSLIDHLPSNSMVEMLRAIGRYMRTIHKIEYEYAGYIATGELKNPPDPDSWQHIVWTFEQFEREVTQNWQEDKQMISTDLMTEIESYYAQHKMNLKAVYQTPRFTHGDCHASTFFLFNENQKWQISGVLDMEVASAGNIYFDFLKFGIEMAAYAPIESLWWEYLFEGYGTEPSFELLKLMLLAVNHHNYTWLWNCSRENLLEHLLSAQDWAMLWDFRRFATIIPQ